MTDFTDTNLRNGITAGAVRCEALDRAALAGYLYGECEPGERAAIDAHLAVCAACAAEVVDLGATRTSLAAWTPPEVALGFRITSEREDNVAPFRLKPEATRGGPDAAPTPRWWQQWMPAWAQAAAAVAIFAAGAALGMRSAVEPTRAGTGGTTQAVATAAPGAVSTQDLAALEQRIRQEISALRTATPIGSAQLRAVTADSGQPAALTRSDERLLQQVRNLLIESEQRQDRELALRLSQVVRDLDAQRRVDLARIEQTFGQMEGITGPELRDQRQMLNYLIRTSSQRPQ